jgi:pSer/pThr/pTyr-binding forkhead associated (FHA) protein
MIADLFLAIRLFLAFFLLLFFAWAIWVIWSDLKQQTQKITNLSVPAIFISPESDPENKIRFNLPEVIIGRDESCNFRIDKPTISARHARFSFHHNQWWVEDLNSSNGTYINNEPVSIAIVLTSNDLVRFGEMDYRIDLE